MSKQIIEVSGLTIKQINAFKPCSENGRRVRKLLRAYNPDKDAIYTAADAKAAGCTLNEVIWIVSVAARKDPALGRKIRLWSADCAARVLHIYEKDYPNDNRPRNAIQATRDFANGLIDAADARAHAARADAVWAAAARDAAAAVWAADAVWAAAAAVWAAAAALIAADAAHAADAVWAAAHAADAAWAAAAARDAEEEWQFDRICQWLSNNEPEVWPMDGAALEKKP